MRETPNRMLNFLTTPAKPAGDACRSNPRRRSTARIELAWGDGREWRTISGRLRDISRDGASLLARHVPPLTRLARLRIAEGEGSPWIEAEILGVEHHTPTIHRIRLQFAEPCPSYLLRVAVLDVTETGEESSNRHEWAAWRPVNSET